MYIYIYFSTNQLIALHSTVPQFDAIRPYVFKGTFEPKNLEIEFFLEKIS